MAGLKGFKVSLEENDVKKGIGAKSLQDLARKVVVKFELPAKARVFIFLPDGTEVDDEEYFQNLPPQSHLIASTSSALKLSPNLTKSGPLEQFLEALRWQGGAREAVELIQELLLRDKDGSGEKSKDLDLRWQRMADFVQNQQNKMTSFRLKFKLFFYKRIFYFRYLYKLTMGDFC